LDFGGFNIGFLERHEFSDLDSSLTGFASAAETPRFSEAASLPIRTDFSVE
jgi:hypothetical protein